LLAARLLAQDNDIHVFEANNYVGGHTNTVSFEAFGSRYSADTGSWFQRPHLSQFHNACCVCSVFPADGANELQRAVRQVRFSNTRGVPSTGLFAQRRNLPVRPSTAMLRDILRFNRSARELMREGDDSLEMGEYLARGRTAGSSPIITWFPWARPYWSAAPDRFLHFPARFLIRSLTTTGLLSVRNHPRWQNRCGRRPRDMWRRSPSLEGKIRLIARLCRRPS